MYDNAPMAYEAWMWDDGLGSSNGDCTQPNRSGCWGHRHNVLWKFNRGARLAMGAAAGRDRYGHRSYAMLLVGGLRLVYKPAYVYTWRRAVADGAGR
jgi:hypothetical protein